ncbi:MAG: hypothetical protein KDB68_10455 [Planctomycetes bacterium]|nr:hypothetical protein [Planctomycetota bacterium]MCA8936607.1 hypothetical protein [Planctomycetota bacterium]MCA8944619.1 hypothetical protein [Planctomycetota bacterium]
MADEGNAPAVVEQQSLDAIGVSKELAENAKLMWILSGVLSFWGPVIFGYIVKKEGQQESAWYQDQIKKCWMVAIISFIGSWCGIGWLFGIYLGFLGMSQIGEGKDPNVMLVAPKGFQPGA